MLRYHIDLNDTNEFISFVLYLSNDVRVGFIAGYRPPHPDNEDSFFDALESQVTKFENDCKDILVAGDLNYNNFDPIKSDKLISFNSIHGFTNTISKAILVRIQLQVY